MALVGCQAAAEADAGVRAAAASAAISPTERRTARMSARHPMPTGAILRSVPNANVQRASGDSVDVALPITPPRAGMVPVGGYLDTPDAR